MDPLLQYGPNDMGGPGPIQIALVVIGILVGSWILGAAWALIVNYRKGKTGNE